MSVHESPFHSVLDTNYAPDESELDQIRALTVAPLLEIEKLDLEIQRLQKARAALQSFVESHHALVSPIRGLIPEILQQIFIACLPSAHNAIMHKSQAPVLLTRVCRRWREIAMGTAELWASLHITIPLDNSANEYNAALSEGVRAWIARTGALPIDLSVLTDAHTGFYRHSGRHDPDAVDFGGIVTELARHSSRWRSVHVSVGLSATSMSEFEGLKSVDVPMLEQFAYSGRGMDIPQASQWATKESRVSFLQEAPALKNLVITDTTFWLPKTPSHQLVDLTLQFMCFEFNGTQGTEIALFSTLNFLAECTALEVCSVKLQNAHSQGVESVKPFRMERLRSLCFHLYGSSRHGTPVGPILLLLVLDLLTLPALQELDVRFGAGSGSLSDALEQLLVRSETASLRKLSLHFYVAPTTSPINSLRLSPELTDFKTYSSATDTMWGDMIDGVVCPKLERLTLMHLPNETIPEDSAFMAFLRDRSGVAFEKSSTTSTLKKLTIVCREDTQLSEDLKEIRKAGVDVVLSCTSRRAPKRISPFYGVPGQALGEDVGMLASWSLGLGGLY